MQKYLITPTLHNSFYWHKRLEKPKEDFLSTLRKEPFEKTQAMQDGITFEDNVEAYTQGILEINTDDAYYQCVKEIGENVKGGLWQERLKKDIYLDGSPYLLYGKSDVIKRDWIYDIKFTKNYDIGKFKYSIQHLLYMHCTGIEKFAYLISDGKNVWREDYFWQTDSEQNLMAELSGLIKGISNDNDFKQAYQEHWKCKY